MPRPAGEEMAGAKALGQGQARLAPEGREAGKRVCKEAELMGRAGGCELLTNQVQGQTRHWEMSSRPQCWAVSTVLSVLQVRGMSF